MPDTTRNISVVYDTASIMSQDANLKEGMVVQTLGLKSVNDNYGAIYKIMKNPNDKIGVNDFILTKNPKLKAVYINSSNSEARMGSYEKKLTTHVNNIQNCSKINEITLASGVKIVLLANGQKAVVVNSSNVDASTITIVVNINDENKWAIPCTLKLLDFSTTSVYLNENCNIQYTAATSSTEENLTFAITERLNPAIYYYM